MGSKSLKSRVQRNVSKRIQKHFDIDKFLSDTFGKAPGHLSFDEIQEFARSADKDDSKFDTVKVHVDTCERCKILYEDIVHTDPFLSVGRPIPEGFWESFWRSVEATLPENLRRVLDEASDDLVNKVREKVACELGALFSDVEYKLRKSGSFENFEQVQEFSTYLTSLRESTSLTIFDTVNAFLETYQNRLVNGLTMCYRNSDEDSSGGTRC
jgi:hypothetical protein